MRWRLTQRRARDQHHVEVQDAACRGVWRKGCTTPHFALSTTTIIKGLETHGR